MLIITEALKLGMGGLRNILLSLLFLSFSVTAMAKGIETGTVLTANKINEKITIDGITNEPAWNDAKILNILISDGTIGTITVSMKALYDNDYIYMLASWADPTLSIHKKQWIFDNKNQKWMQASMLNAKKERVMIDEDRFSLIWNINDSVRYFNLAACAVICHGDRMNTNRPDEKADLWHWKASRTNPLGYTDDYLMDNTIKEGYDHDAIEAAMHGDRRNKYSGISEMAGNYIENIQKIPSDSGHIEAPRYYKPHATGEEALFITQDDIVNGRAVQIKDPLSIEKKLSIPGYILFRPTESRGDIDTKGIWENGIWTLEIKRKLITNNNDDVQFDITKLYRFGIAVSDNTGGFQARGIGHSFDLGARTLEFGGKGIEEITKMILIKDYLLISANYSRLEVFGLAHSEINMAFSIFNEIQQSLVNLDPELYINIKSSFVTTKRNPSIENIAELISKIDRGILLLQGKIPPAEQTWAMKLIALWGKTQIYIFIFIGLIALMQLFRSFVIIKKEEFQKMGIFIFIIMLPIIFESIGRLGVILKIAHLQKLSFMTNEYATLLWALLMAVALFIAKKGFIEIEAVINVLTMQKNRLQELSITDPLTSLFNRRHLYERLAEFLTLSKRYNTPFSLLMIDIDHFKAVNDTYGHFCGDAVLQGIADALKAFFRENIDVISRYGGEEFAVLLYDTTKDSALNIAERIRLEIQENEFYCKDRSVKIKITVSIGIATVPFRDTTDENSLINKADQALYKAKNSGRNCVKI